MKFKFTTQERQWLARGIRRALGNLIADNKIESAKLLADNTYSIEWEVETDWTISVAELVFSGIDEYGCDMISVECNVEDYETDTDKRFVDFMNTFNMDKVSADAYKKLEDAIHDYYEALKAKAVKTPKGI